jgi:hypothetical protein
MGRFALGTFDADKFNKVFGLSSGNSTYEEGSSTGVKSNPALGEGYLGKEDYERLRNSDKIWDAYAAVNGQEAMKEKRESNPDGLSPNALDATLDDLAIEKPEEQDNGGQPAPPIEVSPRLAHATARVAQQKEDVFSGKYSSDLYDLDYDPAAKSFLDRYKDKLGPQTSRGTYFDPGDKQRYDKDMERLDLNSEANQDQQDKNKGGYQ